jgi:hypothetical protein
VLTGTAFHVVTTQEKRLTARKNQPIGAIVGGTSSGAGMLASTSKMVESRFIIVERAA